MAAHIGLRTRPTRFNNNNNNNSNHNRTVHEQRRKKFSRESLNVHSELRKLRENTEERRRIRWNRQNTIGVLFFLTAPIRAARMSSSGAGPSATDNIYLPGTVSLLQDLDKKLMVLLRDGRVLIGILRSIDQFANLVLHRTIERIHVGKKYGDIPRGVFIVRGENVVLLGEFDESRECLADLQEVGVSEILEIQREDTRQRKETEDRRTRALRERGLLQYSLFESAQNEDF